MVRFSVGLSVVRFKIRVLLGVGVRCRDRSRVLARRWYLASLETLWFLWLIFVVFISCGRQFIDNEIVMR